MPLSLRFLLFRFVFTAIVSRAFKSFEALKPLLYYNYSLTHSLATFIGPSCGFSGFP